MADVRRYRGLWWLRSTNDGDVTRVGGILTIDAVGRVRLEVMSSLLDELVAVNKTIQRSAHSSAEPMLIHGAAEGKPITLLNCMRANGGSINLLPVRTETQVFRADAALVGRWLDDPEEAIFDGIRVEISHLTEWSGRSGLSREIRLPHPEDERSSDTKKSAATHTIELRTVPTIEMDLPDEDISVALLSAQSFGPGGKENAWGRSYQVKERTLFEVRATKPQNAFGFQESLRPMQNLLTLATQSACAVEGRRLIPARDDTSSQPQMAELFFHGDEVEIKATRDRHDLLFDLDDLGGPTKVEAWYRLSRQIGPPMNVLFGLDYEAGGYYDARLFTVATVVEGFHAALCPKSTAIGPAEHANLRKLIKAALKDLDGHLREWALNAVGHNRSGLKQRCIELSALVDPSAADRLLGDRTVWAKWLVRARNAVGHGNLDDKPKIPEEAYHRLADVTKCLLHLVLMGQLGLDGEKQQRAVADHWGYQARRFRALVAEHKTA